MSVLSEVSICNSALIKIGHDRINSLTEQSKAAVLCAERYPFVRDEVLREHPWNFAIKRASFSQLVSTPAFEYQYEYQIPSDCLRIWQPEDPDVVFVVEAGKVLTDEGTFKCRYISRVTNTALFDRSFAEALAFRLAADIGYSITASTQLQQAMLAMYDMKLKIARSMDAQEGTPEDLINDSWVERRF
jgi:hypothetical protein